MSFKSDEELGKQAAWSVCQSLMQMNAAVFARPYKTDRIRLTDIVCAFPLFDGNPSNDAEITVEFRKNYGDIWPMNIDTKGGANYPLFDDVLNDHTTRFLIEWKSGNGDYATPLSTKNAAVTHLALMRIRDDDGYRDGYRPFYLLQVPHLRSFYRKYNGTGYAHCLRGKYSHCALINCAMYAKEYGFLYFQFLHAEQRWGVTMCGKEWECPSSLRVGGEGMLMFYLSQLAARERQALAEGELRPEHLMETEETSAFLHFGGDKEEQRKQAFAEAEKYDPEYKPKRKQEEIRSRPAVFDRRMCV